MELWKKLCLTPQGRFLVTGSLCLDLKHEYSPPLGRISILFSNRGKGAINCRVHIPPVDFMAVQQMNEAPGVVQPGQQVVHYVQVNCMRPFQAPARYLVEFMDGPGQAPNRVPLLLPAVLTKFI